MTNMLPGKPGPHSDVSQETQAVPTITCHICQAIYAPREEKGGVVPSTPRALETTFMSMCHFCFRCRRPACPDCWDTIHGVCGECGLEANLPFRAPTAPLRGVLFPVRRQAQLRRKRVSPIELICIQPGRFQKMAPIEEAETRPIRSTTLPQRSSQSSGMPHPRITRQLSHPTGGESPETISTSTSLPEAPHLQFRKAGVKSPIPPARPRVAQTQKQTFASHFQAHEIHRLSAPLSSQTDDGANTLHYPYPTAQETQSAIADIKTRPESELFSPHLSSSAKKYKISPARQIELIFTWTLLSLLIALIILIVTACISQSVNIFILQTVHINIYDELTYLWYLVTQIHR